MLQVGGVVVQVVVLLQVYHQFNKGKPALKELFGELRLNWKLLTVNR